MPIIASLSQFLYVNIYELSCPLCLHAWLLILIAIVGDITPSDGIPKEEKSRREQAALNEMCEVLGGGLRGTHVLPYK